LARQKLKLSTLHALSRIFNWTYTNQDIKIVLVADYYVKVPKVTTLVRIAENTLDWPQTMMLPEYNKRVKDFDGIEQVPEILEATQKPLQLQFGATEYRKMRY